MLSYSPAIDLSSTNETSSGWFPNDAPEEYDPLERAEAFLEIDFQNLPTDRKKQMIDRLQAILDAEVLEMLTPAVECSEPAPW